MRKQNSDFEARFISEEGSRLKNRDYFGYVELDEFACYVIADGITEVTDVESARLAIETVILSFQENPSLSKRAVKRLLKRANRALLGKESDRRLKASITVVVTDYQKMRYGYVGNTRLRMYRGGAVYRQTRDMSLAQEMVEQEKIAKDELMQHEERNNLYAYLGQKNFKPVVSKKIKLAETDMIALYTRGIWENVDEAELDDVFAEADNEVQTTVDNIEDLLLSRQPENLDNYTLAVIFVNKVYQNPEKRKRIKKIVMITVIVVIAAIVIGVVLWFLRDRKVQRTEDMNYHFTNEPLITPEIGKEAAGVRKKLREQTKSHAHPTEGCPIGENIFDKVLYCGVCGRKMTRHSYVKHYADGSRMRIDGYFCLNGGATKTDSCPSSNRIPQNVLTDILFSLLEKEFDTSLKKKRIYLDKAGEIIWQKKQELERSLRSVTYAKERLAEEESDKYMAYRMGNLSQKDYVEYKMCKENRLRDLEKQEKNFREQEVSLERDGETYLKAVRALIKLKNEQVLTRELIESLIDKIYVYPGKRVEVLFTYSDALVERQVKK